MTKRRNGGKAEKTRKNCDGEEFREFGGKARRDVEQVLKDLGWTRCNDSSESYLEGLERLIQMVKNWSCKEQL